MGGVARDPNTVRAEVIELNAFRRDHLREFLLIDESVLRK